MHVTFYRHFIRCKALMQMTCISTEKKKQWFQFQSQPNNFMTARRTGNISLIKLCFYRLNDKTIS